MQLYTVSINPSWGAKARKSAIKRDLNPYFVSQKDLFIQGFCFISFRLCLCYEMKNYMYFQADEPSRVVRHLHFVSWVDKSRPDQCFPLLAFRQKVNVMDDMTSSPLLVHCR